MCFSLDAKFVQGIQLPPVTIFSMNENPAAPRNSTEKAPVAPSKFTHLFVRATVFEERGNVAEALAIYRIIATELSNKEAKSEFGEWVRLAIRRLQEKEGLARLRPTAQTASPQAVQPQVAQQVTAALDRPAPDARGASRANPAPVSSSSPVLQLVEDPQFATMNYQDLLRLVFASSRTPQEDELRLPLLLTTLARNPDNIDVAWKLAEYYVCNNDPANAVAAHRHIESCYVRMEEQGPPLSAALVTDRAHNFRQLANNRRRVQDQQTSQRPSQRDSLPANPDLSPGYLATKNIRQLTDMRFRLSNAGRFPEAVIIQQYIVDNHCGEPDDVRTLDRLREFAARDASQDTSRQQNRSAPGRRTFFDGGGFF